MLKAQGLEELPQEQRSSHARCMHQLLAPPGPSIGSQRVRQEQNLTATVPFLLPKRPSQ